MSQLTVRKTGGLSLRGSLRPLIFVAGLISLSPQISGAGTNPGQQTFGPTDALHVVVAGNSSSGYRAEIYDRNQLITTRGLAGKYDLTAFSGTSDNQPTRFLWPRSSGLRLEHSASRVSFHAATLTKLQPNGKISRKGAKKTGDTDR
jgi:hypothetical protein